MIAASVYLN